MYSQIGEYKIDVVGSRRQDSNAESGCDNWYDIKANYTDGSSDWVAQHISFFADNIVYPISHTKTFSSGKKIKSLYFYSERGDRRRCTNKPTGQRTINITSTCFYANYELADDLMGNGIFNEEAEIFIYPILEIIPPGIDNFLPVNRNITIYSKTGFATSEYNWQYTLNPSPNPSDWIDLPQFHGRSSITTNATAILGANANTYHGQKITFRQKACNVTSKVNGEYYIRLDAPKILSSVPTDVSCYDLSSQNGKVKIQFDRALYPNEQLSIDLDPDPDRSNIILNADNTYVVDELMRGNYKLKLIGSLNGLSTDSPTAKNPILFKIDAPPPVDFSLNSTNVKCKGAQDGTITINVTGGNRSVPGNDYYAITNADDSGSQYTWISFPNNVPHTITGLLPGNYNIKIKDTNDCIAKEQKVLNGIIELGNDKILKVVISEPTSPLTLNYTLKKDPTFYGAANGKIVAAITGGTIKDDKTYEFEWKNSNGDILPATAQYNAADKTYNITLENVPDGEYKLTVKDKNYISATNKTGCSIIESSQIVSQPDQIIITLEQTQAISCNTQNSESDINKLSDGILKATVNGGVKFTGSANNGLPYIFIWSKYNTATNLWEELTDYKTDTAENLSEGNYSLNVEDANGIVQGTYTTTDLVTAIPATQEILEPTQLELSFTSRNVSCHEGNNGWATAIVTGGTRPYTYTWYNAGDGVVDGNKVSELTAGEYFVEAKDAKGCFVKGSIVITEPDEEVKILYEEIFTPTFSGATNGRIVAKITGGTPNDDKSYNYEWKNAAGVLQSTTAEIKDGIYTITLDGVPADDYFLTIKDKNYNEAESQIINCSVLGSEVKLTEPDPLKVVFEIIQTISCNGSNEFGDNVDTTPNDGQRDESQDGILKAHVTGGALLAADKNNGLPYYFYWKKQQPDGSWMALSDIKGETASNLSHGNYALNIEDRNGIKLGTYINNLLTEEVDVTQFMHEPPKLSVSITKGDVFCNGGNDGWATANVIGGTPPYDYKWSNGVEEEKNTILTKGSYWVIITDDKQCTTYAEVEITEPKEPISIQYKEVINPSFYRATNGKLLLKLPVVVYYQTIRIGSNGKTVKE